MKRYRLTLAAALVVLLMATLPGLAEELFSVSNESDFDLRIHVLYAEDDEEAAPCYTLAVPAGMEGSVPDEEYPGCGWYPEFKVAVWVLVDGEWRANMQLPGMDKIKWIPIKRGEEDARCIGSAKELWEYDHYVTCLAWPRP